MPLNPIIPSLISHVSKTGAVYASYKTPLTLEQSTLSKVISKDFPDCPRKTADMCAIEFLSTYKHRPIFIERN